MYYWVAWIIKIWTFSYHKWLASGAKETCETMDVMAETIIAAWDDYTAGGDFTLTQLTYCSKLYCELIVPTSKKLP